MSRFTSMALGLAMLAAPVGSALAEGEGSFQPQSVASPASGAARDAGIGGSFVFNQAEGGQLAVGQPASPASGTARAPRLAVGAYQFNSGLNG